MNQAAQEQLIELWMNDSEFRDEFRADPLRAVEATGLDVGEDLVAAVRELPVGLTDEQLQERISRVVPAC